MKAYVLSILGVTICGIIIDVIIPSGKINNYIKSIYSIFVVAVILTPLINFFSKGKDFTLNYQDYAVNEKLLNFISNSKVDALEKELQQALINEGYSGVDINLNFSLENDEIVYNSCNVNISKLVIAEEKKHINKYQFISGVIEERTNLASEVIVFDEWFA